MQILAIYLSSSSGLLIDTTRGAHIVKQNYDWQRHLSTFLYAIFLNIIAMFSSKESIFDPTRHGPCHWIILARAQEIHSILHQCILYTFFNFLRHLYCISIKWWTFYLSIIFNLQWINFKKKLKNTTMCASLTNQNNNVLCTVERFTIGVQAVQSPMYSSISPPAPDR